MEEKEEVLDLENELDQARCEFRRDSRGIFMRDFQIEALLAQCATTLGITMKTRGSKGIIQHGLFVEPREIHFIGRPEADGFEDMAGNVQTPKGKKSILRSSEYVEKGSISFRLKLLTGQTKLSEKNLITMMHLGQENGLGSCRKMGGGKFDVTRFEKVE